MLKVKSNMGACKSDMYASLTNIVFCLLVTKRNLRSVLLRHSLLLLLSKGVKS